MILHSPLIITPRLMVGVEIGRKHVPLPDEGYAAGGAAYTSEEMDLMTKQAAASIAWVSLGTGPRNAEGRAVYGAFIDLPDGTEHEVTDLRSGCGGGGIQDGLASLLSFLGAAAESYAYRQRTGRDGENEHLFPPAVVQWAAENADEISMLGMDIEESPTPLIED